MFSSSDSIARFRSRLRSAVRTPDGHAHARHANRGERGRNHSAQFRKSFIRALRQGAREPGGLDLPHRREAGQGVELSRNGPRFHDCEPPARTADRFQSTDNHPVFSMTRAVWPQTSLAPHRDDGPNPARKFPSDIIDRITNGKYSHYYPLANINVSCWRRRMRFETASGGAQQHAAPVIGGQEWRAKPRASCNATGVQLLWSPHSRPWQRYRHRSAAEYPFGYIYTTDTQPKGRFELEQWITTQRGQSRGDYSNIMYRRNSSTA